MKRSSKQEAKKKPESKPVGPAEPVQPIATFVTQVASAAEEEEYILRNAPPADLLLHEAEQEPSKLFLAEYFEVIRTLREKRYSFREIADWLVERGLEVDHNAVYRAFTNGMTPEDQMAEEEREREEAEREESRH